MVAFPPPSRTGFNRAPGVSAPISNAAHSSFRDRQPLPPEVSRSSRSAFRSANYVKTLTFFARLCFQWRGSCRTLAAFPLSFVGLTNGLDSFCSGARSSLVGSMIFPPQSLSAFPVLPEYTDPFPPAGFRPLFFFLFLRVGGSQFPFLGRKTFSPEKDRSFFTTRPPLHRELS